MTRDGEASTEPRNWSVAGFALGMRLAMPAMAGMITFGLAVGATAARKGFALIDSVLMNLFVFAGASQLVAMEIWPARFTLAAIAALTVVVAVVNARMLLITASLHPWLNSLPGEDRFRQFSGLWSKLIETPLTQSGHPSTRSHHLSTVSPASPVRAKPLQTAQTPPARARRPKTHEL